LPSREKGRKACLLGPVGDFSESRLSAKDGELRGFSAISRGKAAAFLCSSDLLVEDAVRCEPVSGANSLLTGKNTASFLKIVDCDGVQHATKLVIHSYLYSQASTEVALPAGNLSKHIREPNFELQGKNTVPVIAMANRTCQPGADTIALTVFRLTSCDSDPDPLT
jgi:hypothetical protein